MQEIIALDEQLLLAINSCHNSFWDTFMYCISDKWIWIPLYACILFALYRRFGWRTLVMAILLTALAITASDQVSSHLIRPLVQRMRPSNPNNPLSEFVHVVNDYRGGRYGFPSSHAANTFAAAMLTACLFKRASYSIFIFLWAALVCYSRMYLGVHYPGDILVGSCIGLFFGYGFYYVGTLLPWRPAYSQPSHGRQPSDLPIAAGILTIAAIAVAAAMQQAT